ncbi:hypothetical protein D3C81_07030 [compost metagenome]
MNNIFERVESKTYGIETNFLKLKEGVKAKLSTKIDIGILSLDKLITMLYRDNKEGESIDDFVGFFNKLTKDTNPSQSGIVIEDRHTPIVNILNDLPDYITNEDGIDFLTKLKKLNGDAVSINVSYYIDDELATITCLLGAKDEIIEGANFFINWNISSIPEDFMFKGVLCSLLSCTKLFVSTDEGKNYNLESIYYSRDMFNAKKLADNALVQYDQNNKLSKHRGVDIKVEIGFVSLWEADVPNELITEDVKNEIDSIIAEEGVTLLDYVELHSNMQLTQ